MTRPIALHGKQTSLLIESDGTNAPLWLYWGPRLAGALESGPDLAAQPWARGFTLDQPLRFPLFAGYGMGWFGRSAIEAHRDGRDFAFAPDRVDLAQDAHALTIVLDDSIAQIGLRLVLALDPHTDVLSFRSTVTNRANRPLQVQWLASAVLPLPPQADRVRYYAGRHASEFEEQEDRLGKATWLRENRHGITSHDCFPGAVVATPATTESGGLTFAAQLAWSGNHCQAIEWLDDGRRQWQLGVALSPGELQLAPGASHEAPEVLATCSLRGWQGTARNFHQALRQRVTWPGGAMKPRPVHLNTWEGCYFDHDEASLIELADRAAALGIERFVLDDGWFHRRDDDTSSLGDWWPDERKYPRGLRPLADHVVARGMEFGLWIEPEMVNPDSDLFRAHPDWALQLAGRPQQLSRNQLVLDLTNPAVGDYLFDTIGRAIADLPLSYLKWDHNRDLVAAGDASGRPAYRRQVLAFYALLERFRAAFPGVEIESCAGGGGRIDAGVLSRVHRFWASDCIDAQSRLSIQRGFLQFFPPELMGSHVGAQMAHTTGRSQPLDFRAAVACQGHFGVELDIGKLDQDDTGRLRDWIAFYKDWRHLLHGDVWNGSLPDGQVWHGAGSADEWLLFVYRTAPTTQRYMPDLPLRFVDEAADYAVTRIGPGRGKADPTRIAGTWLHHAGLPTPPMKAERVAIFHGRRA